MVRFKGRRPVISIIGAFCLGCVLGLKLDPETCDTCEAWGTPGEGSVPGVRSWPEWCGGPSRNSISTEEGLIDGFQEWHGGKGIHVPRENVLWIAELAEDQSKRPEDWIHHEMWSDPVVWGSPVVAGGQVYLGGALDGSGSFTESTTGALWCFNEHDGSLLWCFRSRFIRGLYNRSYGIAATPTVEGDRVYVVNHLADVVCLDAKGLADGNDGPYRDEGELLTAGLNAANVRTTKEGRTVLDLEERSRTGPIRRGKLTATDGDVIWRYDMYRELSCRPHNCLTSGILIRGDLLYLGTCSTGAAMRRTRAARTVKNIWTPIFIALDKNTGKLAAVNDKTIPAPYYHGANASPSLGLVNGKELIFYGDGRGYCYAFDAVPVPGEEGAPGTLKAVWRIDCTKPTIIGSKRGDKRVGPMTFEIIATPVFHENKVYVALGNDPKYSGRKKKLPGRLLCIDATRTGDITEAGVIWRFDEIGSSCTTVSISDGLLFTADLTGRVFCLDHKTGELIWEHQTSPVWSSPLVADGKVYLGTQGSGLLIFAASREKNFIHEGGKLEIAGSAAAANGVVYVGSHHALFALKPGIEGNPPLLAKIRAAFGF